MVGFGLTNVYKNGLKVGEYIEEFGTIIFVPDARKDRKIWTFSSFYDLQNWLEYADI